MKSQELPRVSVVTVGLDCERTIARTLDSIVAQEYRPSECIVIDGGSCDRTVEIARGYADRLPMTVVSARDRGIFDAMNRGLALATSEVVGFLNANDWYADDGALKVIAQALVDRRVDACFGNLDFVSRTGKVSRLWHSSPYSPRLLRSGWVPPHPTFYCRRSVLLAAGGFKAEYRYAGDYELLLRLFRFAKIRTEFIPQVLVHMEAGGVSNRSLRNVIAANREVARAWKQNRLSPPLFIGLRKPMAKLLQLRVV